MLSRPLLQDVIKNLDLDTNYRSLAGQVSITNTNDTRILKVTVTDSDPERAADIANELIKQARIYLPEIMETETPNVVEDAVVPTQKSSPSYAKNTVLGAGRCGQVSGRPAAGYHPGGRSGQLQPQ